MRVILFNLSPYRVQRENRKKRRVIAELAAGGLVGVLLCFGIDAEFDARVAAKQQFLSNLSAMEEEMATRVAEVQAMKDRVTVLNRQVGALRAVEQESLLASKWLSYLDSTVPGNVSLSKVQVSNDVMVVNGFTDAVSSLATWVDQMEAGNSLFEAVDLVSVTEAPKPSEAKVESPHLFEIRAILRGVQHEAR